MPEQGYKIIEHIILPPHATKVLGDALKVSTEIGVAEFSDNVAARRELRKKLNGHLKKRDGRDLEFENSEELREAALELVGRAEGIVPGGIQQSRFHALEKVLNKYGMSAIDQERALELTRDATTKSRKWRRRLVYRNVLQSRLFDRAIVKSIEGNMDLVTARAVDVFAEFFTRNIELIERIHNSYFGMEMMERHKRFENVMRTIFGMQLVNNALDQIHEGLFAENYAKTAQAVVDHGANSPGAMVSFIHRLHGLFLMSVHGEWNLTSLGAIKERLLRLERFGDPRIAVSTLTYIGNVGIFSDDPVANYAKLDLWQAALDLARVSISSEKSRLPTWMDLDEIQGKISRRKGGLRDYFVQYGAQPDQKIRTFQAPRRLSGQVIPFIKPPILTPQPKR
jgi:hypothetical protein